MDDINKDSKSLGNVLIGSSFVIVIEVLFAWVWIPDVQRPGLRRGRRVLVSVKLDELARGRRRAEEDGQIIGFRGNFRRRLRHPRGGWMRHRVFMIIKKRALACEKLVLAYLPVNIALPHVFCNIILPVGFPLTVVEKTPRNWNFINKRAEQRSQIGQNTIQSLWWVALYGRSP